MSPDRDIAALLASIRSRPLKPLERVTAARSADKLERMTHEIIEFGWRSAGQSPVSLHPPIPWEDSTTVNRSWAFHLHSWDQIEPVLDAHSHLADDDLLVPVLATVLDWVGRYSSRDGESSFTWYDDAASFAWYDMSVGLRAQRFAYFFDAVVRTDVATDADLEAMWRSLELHAEALADPSEFKSHNNHGFYQAAGLTALATRLPEIDPDGELLMRAGGMLEDMIGRQFGAGGVHLEHSPDYHRMVLGTLVGLRDADLLVSDGIDELIEESEDALAWFVMPNGRLPTMGDSVTRRLGPGTYPSDPDPGDSAVSSFPWRTEFGRWIASGGDEGERPVRRIRGFDDGGYVIARDDSLGSFVLMQAGFHSRTHKHADDLSIVWMERGREILVDAGLFGYLGATPTPGTPEHAEGHWYSDPRRMYVESTRAHNTVEIDGRNHDRIGRTPYGAGLTGCGEQDEILYGSGTVAHGPVNHRRVIVSRPGSWLVVLDRLIDLSLDSHQFRSRFHLHPSVELQAGSGNQVSRLLLEDGTPVTVCQLS